MTFRKLALFGALAAMSIGVGGGALTAAGPSDAAAKGQASFQAKCSMCHASAAGQPSVMGPNLSGVVGRDVASAHGFTYSQALVKKDGTWTPAELNEYLKAPAKLVPGTRMPVAVPDDAERAAILAYLSTLK